MAKVANLETLEAAKNELIERVKTSLNLSEIKQILEEQHNLEISDDLEVNSGDMFIHNNKIAYRMDFEVLLSLSIVIDEEGNYIPPADKPEESIDEIGSQAEDILRGME